MTKEKMEMALQSLRWLRDQYIDKLATDVRHAWIEESYRPSFLSSINADIAALEKWRDWADVDEMEKD